MRNLKLWESLYKNINFSKKKNFFIFILLNQNKSLNYLFKRKTNHLNFFKKYTTSCKKKTCIFVDFNVEGYLIKKKKIFNFFNKEKFMFIFIGVSVNGKILDPQFFEYNFLMDFDREEFLEDSIFLLSLKYLEYTITLNKIVFLFYSILLSNLNLLKFNVYNSSSSF